MNKSEMDDTNLMKYKVMHENTILCNFMWVILCMFNTKTGCLI